MEWIKMHPYTIWASVICIVLLSGLIIVKGRAPVSETRHDSAWSGFGTTLPSSATDLIGRATSGSGTTESSAPEDDYQFIQLPSWKSAASSSVSDAIFDEALSLLIQKTSSQEGARGEASGYSLAELYALIPRGFVATTSISKARTPRQQSLYEYGNLLAGPIESYGDIHVNQSQMLRDYFEDRGNSAKTQSALGIASDLKRAGKEILEIEIVPTEVAAMHKKLADAYESLGESLERVVRAQGDENIEKAIGAYAVHIDHYLSAYLAFVTFFRTAEIEFLEQDPGRMFTFGVL